MSRIVPILSALMILTAAMAQAGAGVSRLALFEPQAGAGVTTETAAAVATAFSGEVQRLMDIHEVWGIELLPVDVATSAAVHGLGTRAPRWEGVYTPAWITLLNVKDVTAYVAVGGVEMSDGELRARYELRDMVLNSQIAVPEIMGTEPSTVGAALARKTLAALQLYLAEITEVGKGKAMINVGLETLSTGTLLTAYAHGHLGPHPAGYTPHGHREEDDHLLGNRIYTQYRDVSATSASLHTHSRSRWRALLRTSTLAYEHLMTTAPATAEGPGSRPPQPSNPYDLPVTPTPEERGFLEQAHAHSGTPTGVLRVTGFVKPHRFFNSYYAIAEVVEGFALPGGFVALRNKGPAE